MASRYATGLVGRVLLGVLCLGATAQTGGPATSNQYIGPVAKESAAGAAAPPVRRVNIPDLSDPARRAAFESYARDVCDAAVVVASETRADPRPLGDFLSQSPPPGATAMCTDTVTITVSSGPPPSFEVGDLSTAAGVDILERRAQIACGRDLTPARQSRPSRRPAGQYDGQDPQPDETYRCGEAVTVWSSLGPPPPPVPWPWILAGELAVLTVIGGGAALIVNMLRPRLTRYGLHKGEARWTVTPRGPIRGGGPRFALRVGDAPPHLALRGRLRVLSEETTDDRDPDRTA